MSDQHTDYSDFTLLRRLKRIADIAQAHNRNDKIALGDIEAIAREAIAYLEAGPSPQMITGAYVVRHRYAMLALQRIAEGVPMPGKYADQAIKHILGPLNADEFARAQMKPTWWHHIDESGQHVFMSMPFGIDDETAMYTMPPDAAAEIKQLRAALSNLVDYTKNIGLPLSELESGPVGEARQLLEK